ncbi:phosphate/phosphite/phosphonate ABC transporter substrate-binding protein [Brevundimonas sp. M20]|uniref:phosphate/phosphite/phosphonate ABC transporter substrate-binding protein n=1 Tax=Brevundimonas sp. M20 TaxID=2591463 RepID=UPI0011467346|nr:phosphate/phosphite/phosphonate ABC transporter substrate-binding protein [Brevundimonas sp. M20]QDH74561.1 phosphate/phosphite/phosphonate ABC transporter substrate-binding protein [Brevundimonas sp. M20]
MILSGWTRHNGNGAAAVVALALSGLALAACGERDGVSGKSAETISFSILSAQGQASAGPLWQPLLDDMSKAIGAPVEPHFASTYAALVEDMKRGQVQAGWFSAQPAIDAIRDADAELIARTVSPDGLESYRATLIVKAGSGITLESVMACGRRYSFGIGDAQSTSGTLAPVTWLFNPRGIDPERCFSTVRSNNHERNAFEVASGVLDVATSNTVSAAALRAQNPTLAEQIQVIWQSPPIPEGGIVVREDLDPAIKEKIRSFFLTYGQGNGVEAERQRQVLAGLRYSRFNAADDDYLDPVREMMADQRLTAARAARDAEGVAAAEQELQSLRAKRREVQP